MSNFIQYTFSDLMIISILTYTTILKYRNISSDQCLCDEHMQYLKNQFVMRDIYRDSTLQISFCNKNYFKYSMTRNQLQNLEIQNVQ